MEATNDIIEFCRELPSPILVMAHPASGTQWLTKQLAAALDGPVAHEILRGRPIKDWKAVVTFKHWSPGHLRKYASVVACTRNPLDVIPSAYSLYSRQPHIRGTVLMNLFGDGLPHGETWAAAQIQDPYLTTISTLHRWYQLAHKWDPKIIKWFQVENAVGIIDAPSNTKLHKHDDEAKKTTCWQDIIDADPVVAAALMREAIRMGYPVPAEYRAVL